MGSRNDLQLTPEEQAEVEKQVEALREWIQSEEGAEAIRRASERSKKWARKRRRAQRIDPLEWLRRDG